MGRYVYVRRYKCNIKIPQKSDPVLGDTREWKSDYVDTLLFMIRYGGHDRNVDID